MKSVILYKKNIKWRPARYLAFEWLNEMYSSHDASREVI